MFYWNCYPRLNSNDFFLCYAVCFLPNESTHSTNLQKKVFLKGCELMENKLRLNRRLIWLISRNMEF